MGWMRYKRLYAASPVSPLKKKGSRHGYSLPRGNSGRESGKRKPGRTSALSSNFPNRRLARQSQTLFKIRFGSSTATTEEPAKKIP